MRTTACAASSGGYWEKFVIQRQHELQLPGHPAVRARPIWTIALAGGRGLPVGRRARPRRVRDASRGCAPNANTAFGEDVQRGYKQTAAFTSIDLDLIPKVLTITGGIRWYHYDEFEHGSEYYSESTSTGLVVNHLNGVCTAAGLCGFPINLDKTESGHRWRGNLTWHVTNGHHGVLHLFGRLPSGRLQSYQFAGGSAGVSLRRGASTRRYHWRRRTRRTALLPGGSLAGLNTNQFNKPVRLRVRLSDQQRDRHQDRVVRTIV